MGSVYPRGSKLWIRFKGPDGKWTQSKTDYLVGQERLARKLLGRVEDRIAAGAELGEREQGPLTVRRYADRWIEERRKLGIDDWEADESRLRNHILPTLGDVRLAEVRPRHVAELVKKLRMNGKLAPKTIYNIYSVMKALFRDAHLADLIDASPCILTKYQLGENVDKDPEWRATAVYTRDELVQFISDPRVPEDRQVLYGLEGIGALRHGEAAGARWKHYDASLKPLGRILVATSYDKGRTKTKRTRAMPVHETLAAMLDEWKLQGWPAMMGREPTPEDLIVPLPKGPKTPLGKMRTKNDSYKRICKDLEALGLRHRRGHDLRRTMISLARTDGARKDLLELCTHNPGKGQSTIDVYTEFPWDALCAEVAKLRVKRADRAPVPVLPTPVAANDGGTGDASPVPATLAIAVREACDSMDIDGQTNLAGPPLATVLATSFQKAVGDREDTEWRRWESNPEIMCNIEYLQKTTDGAQRRARPSRRLSDDHPAAYRGVVSKTGASDGVRTRRRAQTENHSDRIT